MERATEIPAGRPSSRSPPNETANPLYLDEAPPEETADPRSLDEEEEDYYSSIVNAGQMFLELAASIAMPLAAAAA